MSISLIFYLQSSYFGLSHAWALSSWAYYIVRDLNDTGTHLEVLLWDPTHAKNYIGNPGNIFKGCANFCKIATQYDNNRLKNAGAILFVSPKSMPKIPKSFGQFYILLTEENSFFFPITRTISHFLYQFDYTSTTDKLSSLPIFYKRLDSNVLEKWSDLSKIPSAKNIFSGAENVYVSASISNCFKSPNERISLIEALAKRIKVINYGKCQIEGAINGHSIGKSKKKFLQAHPFHLAFENFNQKDYVTEKLYEAIDSGTVPIYYGAPNVEDFFPTELYKAAIINIADYSDLKLNVKDFDLVAERVSSHLKSLLRNYSAYSSVRDNWRLKLQQNSTIIDTYLAELQMKLNYRKDLGNNGEEIVLENEHLKNGMCGVCHSMRQKRKLWLQRNV